MTQKEKLMRATMMAERIKSIAKSIEYDARDFDCSWPLNHARDLTMLADNFLKLK